MTHYNIGDRVTITDPDLPEHQRHIAGASGRVVEVVLVVELDACPDEGRAAGHLGAFWPEQVTCAAVQPALMGG